MRLALDCLLENDSELSCTRPCGGVWVQAGLVTAARYGDAIRVKGLLDAGVEPTLYGRWPHTRTDLSALYQAAINHHSDCLEILAPHCDVATLHYTLLEVLQQSKPLRSAAVLMKNRLLVTIVSKYAPDAALRIVAALRCYGLVRILLELGFKPESLMYWP